MEIYSQLSNSKLHKIQIDFNEERKWWISLDEKTKIPLFVQ